MKLLRALSLQHADVTVVVGSKIHTHSKKMPNLFSTDTLLLFIDVVCDDVIVVVCCCPLNA